MIEMAEAKEVAATQDIVSEPNVEMETWNEKYSKSFEKVSGEYDILKLLKSLRRKQKVNRYISSVNELLSKTFLRKLKIKSNYSMESEYDLLHEVVSTLLIDINNLDGCEDEKVDYFLDALRFHLGEKT